jgi:hypothetical protein
MTKRIRFIILIICVVLFFLFIPYIIAYSLGYRVDFEQKRIVATGGIYVRANPQPTEFIFDSINTQKPAMFANSVFVQNLLPKQHSVLVKKEGYYDYQKNIIVTENQVVKLEDILLFKKDISFDLLSENKKSPFTEIPDKNVFYIENGNLYNGSDPEIPVLIIKKVSAFELSGNSIIWLGTDGFLYKSDNTGKNTETISANKITINKTHKYKITYIRDFLFVEDNTNLLWINMVTKNLETFYKPVIDFKFSPDNKKIMFYNDNEIFYYLTSAMEEKILIQKFSEKITDCFWLNNEYLIFVTGNKIMISEIDVRGNVNIITLPQSTILPAGTKINIKSPKIIFNQGEGKIYVSTGKTVLVSEKITQ